MISKATIKGYNFETIKEYFEYILDSRTNGQRKQAQKLHNKLSVRHKNDFINWFTTVYHYDIEDNQQTELEAVNELLDYLNK